MKSIQAILFLGFMFLSITLFSQRSYVIDHEMVNPHEVLDTYHFPILNGGDTRITNVINSFLVKEHLQVEWGQQRVSIFEQIWKNKERPYAQLNYLTYQVNLLNKKVYSVTINGEFCGAYCSPYEVHETFDLMTGKPVAMDELLNEEGQLMLIARLKQHKMLAINDQLLKIDEKLSQDSLSFEDREYYNAMHDMYDRCENEFYETKYIRYVPSADSININYGRCSAHFNRALDELLDFRYAISIKEWKRLLTPFGKHLLLTQIN